MKMNEYQNLANVTMNRDIPDRELLIMTALGLAGEAGECADEVKKYLYHGHDFNRAALCKELGDVLWYLSQLAFVCGIELDVVAEENIEKLKKRYPEGFSSEASINRKE